MVAKPGLLGLLGAAVIALAGCAQHAGDGGDTSSTPSAFTESFASSPDTGVIRGLVLTEAIQPIPGANVQVVSLHANRTTDKDGAFVFSGLKPGTYFLQVSAKGYTGARSSGVDVRGGDNQPPIVKLILPVDRAAQPYAQLYQWDGFLECGVGVNGAGAVNPCALDMANSHNTNSIPIDGGMPTLTQVEMRWENTQALSNVLHVGIYNPKTLASDFAGKAGTSPIIFQVDQLNMTKYLANATSMTQRVFPGGDDSSQATVFTNQRFSVYTTEFHGFLPKEDWAFVNDGECFTPADCGR